MSMLRTSNYLYLATKYVRFREGMDKNPLFSRSYCMDGPLNVASPLFLRDLRVAKINTKGIHNFSYSISNISVETSHISNQLKIAIACRSRFKNSFFYVTFHKMCVKYDNFSLHIFNRWPL